MSHASVCPHCGRCSHCGQPNPRPYPYWTYPTYPQWTPQWTTVQGGNTVTWSNVDPGADAGTGTGTGTGTVKS